MNSINFDIVFSKLDDGFRASIIDSSSNESAHADFPLPFQSESLQNILKDIELRIKSKGLGEESSTRGSDKDDRTTVAELGETLYKFLFSPEVEARFRKIRPHPTETDKALRIRLDFTNAPALLKFPWEYLFDGTDSFAKTKNTPVVRSFDLGRFNLPKRPLLSLKPPLRILAMFADVDRKRPIDVENEWKVLERELTKPSQSREIELVRLKDGRLSSLQHALGESEYHVLHFGGHISFDTSSREGMLLFEDEKVSGSSREISSSELGTTLYDHGSLHLVVLNGCEGARTSTKNPSGGVAQKLVQLGVPIVVAMQFRIVDATAKIFAASFYDHIARHESIDTALSYARRSIMQGNDIEWGTPTLYSGHSDGAIFDIWGLLEIGKRLQDEEDRKVKARLKAEKDEADRVVEVQRNAEEKQAKKLLEEAAAVRVIHEIEAKRTKVKRNRQIMIVAVFTVLIASVVAVLKTWDQLSTHQDPPHPFTDVEIMRFYETRADEQSMRSLKKAALQDHNLYAQHVYGKSLAQDKPSESLPVDVLQGWQAAAENGVTDAAVDLGLYYVNRNDVDRAIKNYEQAIKNNENTGAGKLAFAIGQGIENGLLGADSKTKPDLMQALVYFEKAATLRNVGAIAAIERVKPGAKCQEYETRIKKGEGGDLYKLAGDCAYERKDWDSAIGHYFDARAISSSDNRVSRRYATALCLSGKDGSRDKALKVSSEKSGYGQIGFDPEYAVEANRRCSNLSSTSSGQVNKQ